MKDLVERALNTAQVQGSGYAEARVADAVVASLSVKDGHVEAATHRESRGIGVRALVGGAWGFAATAALTPADVDRAAAGAVEIARASAAVPGRRVDLGPAVTTQGSYRTAVERDPFAVPLDEKIALL